MKLPTGYIGSHKRTKKVYFNIQTDSLKKSFFNETVPIWNEFPDKLKIGYCTYIKTKKKYQTILLKQIYKRKRQFQIWKKVLE